MRATEARGLLSFIDASPSPYHACATAADMLGRAGFGMVEAGETWPEGGSQFLVRGGTLIAWAVPPEVEPGVGFRLVGAHTDSPNLRVRPNPEREQQGYRQLAIDVYGGALVNSWLDRDLGLSGRVALRPADGTTEPEVRLLRIDRSLLRVAQLAPHLDRQVRTEGLRLNPQTQVVPILGLAGQDQRGFRELLADELKVSAADILSWDLMLHDLQPGAFAGQAEEFLSTTRLDNLGSSYAVTRAMVRSAEGSTARPRISVICLFDHEEVGSTSANGAAGGLLPNVLERISLGLGWGRGDFLRAMSSSTLISADMAHAVNPNYQEYYEPGHLLHLNAGPAIKINAAQRYATDAIGEALFASVCAAASVPVQRYLGRADVPCGSTIGPLLAARLGVSTVDVGFSQLAMHSARELCGAADVGHMVNALTAFLTL
ncbi:MAG: M18 family aminopeptidase [Candidatus Dormibacteraeota bacterium]|nr:M18 family aminopeptidase [Candidatus Dormibacteraeota bacterium]